MGERELLATQFVAAYETFMRTKEVLMNEVQKKEHLLRKYRRGLKRISWLQSREKERQVEQARSLRFACEAAPSFAHLHPRLRAGILDIFMEEKDRQYKAQEEAKSFLSEVQEDIWHSESYIQYLGQEQEYNRAILDKAESDYREYIELERADTLSIPGSGERQPRKPRENGWDDLPSKWRRVAKHPSWKINRRHQHKAA